MIQLIHDILNIFSTKNPVILVILFPFVTLPDYHLVGVPKRHPDSCSILEGKAVAYHS